MASLPLQLPTLQNWSCHNCGGCCRQHAIELTREEFERIAKQGWRREPGFEPGQPIFKWHSGPIWNRRYQLAHRADGACVFLDENGLCRIHAKFGEAAKPLACRVYPYAFHPAGKQVTVSLRYSCPSVVANRGKTLNENKQELFTLERLVVPAGADQTPPPFITPRQKLDWKDFLACVDALDDTLATPNATVAVKLLRALFWVGLVGQSKLAKIQGERLKEFLQIITQAAMLEPAADPAQCQEPRRLARIHFRMLAAQYARRDTSVEAQRGWSQRWRLLRAAVRFSRGKGTIPPLQEQFREVPFAALEPSFGKLSPEVEEIFTRYFRVKIQGLHFCGPAYYDVPFAEGFQSLALVYPVTLWLARWLAVGEGRQTLTTDDVARALAIADHHHGYSPAFGTGMFRRRVRNLARDGEIANLCAWYSR